MEDNEMCVCCGLALVARDYERGGKSCFNCDTVKDSSAWEELTALRAENERLRAQHQRIVGAADKAKADFARAQRLRMVKASVTGTRLVGEFLAPPSKGGRSDEL